MPPRGLKQKLESNKQVIDAAVLEDPEAGESSSSSDESIEEQLVLSTKSKKPAGNILKPRKDELMEEYMQNMKTLQNDIRSLRSGLTQSGVLNKSKPGRPRKVEVDEQPEPKPEKGLKAKLEAAPAPAKVEEKKHGAILL